MKVPPISAIDPVIWRASELASLAHAGQFRKGDGTAPYISHPIRVALYLTQAGLGPEVVAAGLLHDTIEETPSAGRAAWREQLLAAVGPRVLELVEAVSDANPEAPWAERKDAYLRHLEEAPQEALAVSCADKLDNTLGLQEVLRTQGAEGLKRFNSPLETKIAYHQAVAAITARRWPECPLIEPLRAAIRLLVDYSRSVSQSGQGGPQPTPASQPADQRPTGDWVFLGLFDPAKESVEAYAQRICQKARQVLQQRQAPTPQPQPPQQLPNDGSQDPQGLRSAAALRAEKIAAAFRAGAGQPDPELTPPVVLKFSKPVHVPERVKQALRES